MNDEIKQLTKKLKTSKGLVRALERKILEAQSEIGRLSKTRCPECGTVVVHCKEPSNATKTK